MKLFFTSSGSGSQASISDFYNFNGSCLPQYSQILSTFLFDFKSEFAEF